MPQSRYEAAVVLQFPGTAPTSHYRMDEGSGTSIADYGIAGLAATTNGTVFRGQNTLLTGDPLGFSTSQSKDTVLATRGDNVLFDRPATTNKLTLLAWFRPDDLRSGSTADNFSLVVKGSGVYGLTIAGGSTRADIAGVTGGSALLSTANNMIVPGVPIFVATTFDGAAETWKLFHNGVVVAQRALGSGQVIGHSSGGTMQLGGFNVFGANGIHGRLQHVSVFNAHALPDGTIQDLYRVGVVPPGAEGDQCMYVFPWSREVVAAGGLYDTIQFRNWSPWPVHMSPGATAVKGGGITLAPRGGALPRPSRFTGAWTAILDAPFGHYPLAIEKKY